MVNVIREKSVIKYTKINFIWIGMYLSSSNAYT